MAQIVVQSFLQNKDSGLVSCTKHVLILVGLGALFLPAIALGQTQTPRIQIHTGVPAPALLNSDLQPLEKREQEVVSYRLMLSDEKNSSNPPSGTTSVSGVGLLRGTFLPPLSPLHDQSSGAVEPFSNAGGFVGDRSRDLQKMLGDAQNSLTVLEGNSKTFEVSLDAQPSGNVTVTITGHVGLEVSPMELMFDNTNWSVGQTVTVRAIQDSDDTHETVTLTLTLPGNDTDTIDIKILDDEYLWELSPWTLDEESRGRFRFPLLQALAPPSGDVSFTITGHENSNFILDQTTVTFPQANWQESQFVEAVARLNAYYLNEYLTLTLTASGGGYTGLKYTVDVTIFNDPPHEILVPEGGTERLGIYLYGRIPGVNPTATITGHEGTDLTVIPDQMTYQKDTWFTCSINRVKTWCSPSISIEFSAIEDLDDLDDQITLRYAVTGPSSPENPYRNASQPIYVRIEDNDDTELIVSPSSLEFDEGEMRSFTVKLSDPPLGEVGSNDVTVSVYSIPEFLTLSPSSLTLTSSNWEEGLVMTLTSLHDDDYDDETGTLWLIASGGGYDRERGRVDVEIIDDDTSGLVVSPTPVTVDEGGTTTFTVRLEEEPSDNVQVEISGYADTDLDTTASVPRALTFSASNWSQEQTVTLGAKHDDDFDDESEILTLTASGYFSGTETVRVEIFDDDTPGLVVSPTSVTVDEGETTTFTARLEGEPSGNVQVEISGYADTDLDTTASVPRALTFSASNWSQEQTVTLGAKHDDDYDDESEILTLTASGYSSGTETVRVEIFDNDTPGLVVSPTSVTVDEGGTTTFTVRLEEEPSDNVQVEISGYADTDLDTTASVPRALTFSASNWSQEQTVTLGAKHDDDSVNDSITLTLTATGGITDTETINVSIKDADEPGIVIDPQSLTIDEGQMAIFRVKLGTEPSGNVTVLVPTPEENLIVMPPRRLQFTTGNWNIYKMVTLEAKQDWDGVADEMETLHLTTTGAAEYEGTTGEITVTIKDNELAYIIVNPSVVTVAEGSLGSSFTVALSAKPAADVTVILSDDGDSDLIWSGSTLTGNTLTFTPADYYDAQTVILTAELDDDGPTDEMETLRLTATGAAEYEGKTGEITVTIKDDEQADIIVNPSAVTVIEGSSGSTFTVAFSAEPTADVTVTLSDDGDSDLIWSGSTLIENTLTFTPENHRTPQTITLRAEDDRDGVADEMETLRLTATGATEYEGKTGEVTVTIKDDEQADIVVNPSVVTVAEGSLGSSFTVALSAKPTADVTVTLSDDGDSDLIWSGSTFTGNTLTFTPADYGVQTVILTAELDDDGLTDEMETLRLTATGAAEYEGKTGEITVTIKDNEQAYIVVNPSVVTVAEGSLGSSFTVALSAEPTADVTVTLSDDGDSDLIWSGSTFTGNTLTFTPADYGVQTVILTAELDDDGLTDEMETLRLTATGAAEYEGKTGEITVTIKDNEQAYIVVNPSVVTVAEGSLGSSFTVALSAEPTADVTVTLSDDGDSDLIWSGSTLIENTLTFTPENHRTPQTITLRAEDDSDGVADEMETLRLTATGAAEYEGKTGEITVTIKDDEQADILVNPSAVTITEGSSGSTFTVALSAEPTADVTVTLSDDGDSDLIWSGSTLIENTLTFTPENHRTPQTITLRAEDDSDGVADEMETLRLTATGAAEYEGKTGEITVTIKDDEQADILVNPSAVTVTEGSSGSTFTVALSAEPTADVTVTLSDDGNSDLIWSGSTLIENTLTFTPENHRTPQTITLRAEDDSDGVADEMETLRLTATGAAEYEGKTGEITVTIKDDEQTDIIVNPSAVTVIEGSSGSTFTVAFSAEPTADVTVTLSDDGNSDLIWSGSTLIENTLTFTPENHRTPQTITLRAEDDSDGVADEMETLRLTATGAAEYEGKTGEVTVTIKDDEQADIVVNPSVVTVAEGSLGSSFTVALSAKPTADVTVTLSDDGDSDLIWSGSTFTGNTLTFTPADYGVQTVILTAELDDDGLTDEMETLRLTATGAAEYEGKTGEITVTIKDNEQADIVVDPFVVTVTEGSLGSSFTVALSAEPTADVTVTLSDDGASDLIWSGSTLIENALTFTPENHRTPQTVTLRAEHDRDGVADEMETLRLTASGAEYTGVTTDMTVTIEDDDEGMIVVPGAVTMTEGVAKNFDVSLSDAPSGNVTVMISGYGGTDLADPPPSPLNLVFTPLDYHMPQSVMLTASEDDNDLLDENVTLYLIASGAEYTGVTANVTIMIMDDDEGMIVAPSSVTMEEGSEKTLNVALSLPPAGTVTISISGYQGTDLGAVPPSPLSLTFTPTNYRTAQLLTLSAAEDRDYVDEQETLTLTTSGGGYAGVTANISVTVIDNDEESPLAISIYDVQGSEDAGNLQLPVELSRSVDQVVTVQYASADGTAETGLDYTASRGIVIFDPNATRGVITIEVTNDDISEGTETFTVTLSKPRNAIIARGTGTGTILDDDGGSAILRVDDALVFEEEGMVRFRVSLSHPQRQMISAAYETRDGTARADEDYEASSGVVALAPGTVETMITVPLLKDGPDWRQETFTVHLMSSKHAEIGKAVGVATIQESTTVSEEVLEAYAARFVRTSSVQVVEALGERFRSGTDGAVCGAAARAEMARLWYSASSWDPSLGELLAGCRMSATSYSGSFSVWGQGAFRQFNGQGDGGLTLRGEVTTGILGADYRWRGGWLAGVLLAHSQGEGSFEVVQQSAEITAGLTGVYPYVSYARTGLDVWLSAGAARGQAKVLQLTGDMVSRFGAMGIRGTLVSTGTIGLDYHGDMLMTDAEMKDHAVMAQVCRIRAGVEVNARISDGLRPYVEANVRSDGGSAETGVGLEFGGGIRVAYPAWRLKGNVRSQGILMHTADGFTEWGISGFLQVGSRSEGLMVRVRPSWGRGQEMLIYGQQTVLDAVPIGANAHRTELELGYGVPWRDGTVRSIMGVTQLPQGVMYRLGSELNPWERVRFSVFGLAHGRATALGDIGVNVRGSLRY